MRPASSWHPEVGVFSHDGKKWTVKDYSRCNWIVRNTYGRFLLRKELNNICSLNDVEGIPKEPFLVDEDCIAFEFIEGKRLRDCTKDEISTEYLLECEKILSEIHKKGYVHLDTGAMGNWLVKPDNRPALIDFQSAMRTNFVPKSVKRLLRAIDLRGVYKKWMVFRPDEMGTKRRIAAEKTEKVRRIWLFHPLKKKDK